MPTTTGERVAAARRAAGLSQEGLARKVDTSLGTITAIERDRRDPRAGLKVAIGRALGVDPNDLFRLPVDDLDAAFPGGAGASDKEDDKCMDARSTGAAADRRGTTPTDDQCTTDGAAEAVR